MITTVYQYIEDSARRYPDKVAVEYNDFSTKESITYKELNQFTCAYACFLQDVGVVKQEIVGFFMPKKISAIKAMFSILKSGSVYVPLDIYAPKGRLLSIIESSKIRYLIVNNDSVDLASSLFSQVDNIKLLNIDDYRFDSSVDYLPHSEPVSVDLAYVLFTSGSTGTPKGVMIPHKAIDDYIQWSVETYKLRSEDNIANHAPLYFDNSTFDIYTAFRTGATLHLVPDSINQMIPSLIHWLEESKVSVFFCVPSVLAMLLQTGRVRDGILSDLKQLICAGEVLSPSVLRKWMLTLPHVQFVNMYGPTEITVDCTYHIFDSVPNESVKHVPIGKARKNMELFILTEEGELSQQTGARGELLVRGISVSYGYIGNQEQTKSSFIQNPQNSLYPDLLYKTGDIVELSDMGIYYYIGRKDSQIKYLGHRIELGEIEAMVSNIHFIDETVAIFKQGQSQLEDILGVLVKFKQDIDLDEVWNELRNALPKYMLPNQLIVVKEDFPRTPNGKYDRKKIAQQF